MDQRRIHVSGHESHLRQFGLQGGELRRRFAGVGYGDVCAIAHAPADHRHSRCAQPENQYAFVRQLWLGHDELGLGRIFFLRLASVFHAFGKPCGDFEHFGGLGLVLALHVRKNARDKLGRFGGSGLGGSDKVIGRAEECGLGFCRLCSIYRLCRSLGVHRFCGVSGFKMTVYTTA